MQLKTVYNMILKKKCQLNQNYYHENSDQLSKK